MTRSVKNAAGSFLRCIDATASVAQSLSSVNSHFRNVQSSPYLIVAKAHHRSDFRHRYMLYSAGEHQLRDCGAFI
jgi:hypothetical protein